MRSEKSSAEAIGGCLGSLIAIGIGCAIMGFLFMKIAEQFGYVKPFWVWAACWYAILALIHTARMKS